MISPSYSVLVCILLNFDSHTENGRLLLFLVSSTGINKSMDFDLCWFLPLGSNANTGISRSPSTYAVVVVIDLSSALSNILSAMGMEGHTRAS